jgi:hypothetical protein
MLDRPLLYALPPIPWAALAAPFAEADDALARLDERLRASPVREGWIARTHLIESCAALWRDGALVHLEDLVLHDAGMDVRAPTHELIRAHAYLSARRRIAAAPANWALSDAGLAALRGEGASEKVGVDPEFGSEGDENSMDPGERHESVELDGGGRDDADLDRAFAAVDDAISRARRVIDGERSLPPRDALVYDSDWREDARLLAWRAVLDDARSLPPLLAAAFLFEGWQAIEPLQHRPWLGPLLIGAYLRCRGKTKAHLICLNLGLRAVARQQRRAEDGAGRLIAWSAAIAAAAEAGLQEHDRLSVARQLLQRKLIGRRASSHLAALIDLALAHPIASAGMIAKSLKITPRAAQNLVAELGLREATGRGRYRAWGIV